MAEETKKAETTEGQTLSTEQNEIEQAESQVSNDSDAKKDSGSQEDLASEWEKLVESESIEGQEQITESAAKQLPKEQAASEYTGAESMELSMLMDIPLEISVEVGNATMSIEELLKLTPRSVIELDKFIDDPVDIKVNGKLIAQGRLYTVNDNFGIKITSITTKQERMKLVDEPKW